MQVHSTGDVESSLAGSVHSLITKLCVVMVREADPSGARSGCVSLKELRNTAFSILLNLGTEHRQPSDEKPWDVPVEDRVVGKAFEMELQSRHEDALCLRACLSKLRGASGRCSDGVQACLEFLLCLSKIEPLQPSTRRRLYEFPSITDPSYQERQSVCLVPGVPAFKDRLSELYERIDELDNATSKVPFLPALFAAQPGSDLNGNPLFRPSGQQRPASGPSEDERSLRCSLPKIPPLNPFTRMKAVAKRRNEKWSTKPKACSDALSKEETAHVEQQTIQRSSRTDVDLWESVLRLKSRRLFTWETLGCVQVAKEKPFLTEAGQEAAEAAQRSCLWLSSVVLGEEADSVVVDQCHLVQQILLLLAGVQSDCFPYDVCVRRFVVKKGIRLTGLSSEALAPMLSEFAQCGADVRFLDNASSVSSDSGAPRRGERSLILDAFRDGLRCYLRHYRGALLQVTELPDIPTLMQLHHITSGLREQMGFLANFCTTELPLSNSSQDGMKLLGRLLRRAEEARGQRTYIALIFLLQHACRPYLGFFRDWLFNGICDDRYGEFPIQLNEESAALQDEQFWTSSFALRFGGDDAEEIPFLGDCLDDVFKCAKATMLLKTCRPQTPLFRKDKRRPALTLAFTRSRLEQIEVASRQYLEDAERELEQGALPRLRLGQFPDVEVPDERPKPRESAVEVEAKRCHSIIPRSLSWTTKKDSTSPSLDASAQPSEGSETAQDLLYSATTGTHMKLSGKSSGRQVEESNYVGQGLYCIQTGTYMKLAQRGTYGHVSQSELGRILYPNMANGGRTEQTALEMGAGEPGPGPGSDSVSGTGSGSQDASAACQGEIAPAAEVDTPSGSTDQISNVCGEGDTSKVSEGLAESTPGSCTGESGDAIQDASQTSVRASGEADAMSSADGTDDESDADGFEDKDAGSHRLSDGQDSVSCAQKVRTSLGPVDEGAGCVPYVATSYRRTLPDCVREPLPSRLFPLAEHEPDEESLADWSQDSGFDQLPLEEVMKRSLFPPLKAQIRLVDRACVTFLVKDLGLYTHLEALSNFFCFQDGEFGQAFCDAVCQKLRKPLRSPTDFLNPATLNGVLLHALQSSLRGDSPEASNLSLDAKRIPSVIAPGQNILSCLVLKYKVDWPLNIVITSPCLLRYNKIFGFLLYIRRAEWALFDICSRLKPSALPRKPNASPQYHHMALMRHEMQQFVRLLQSYVGGQVMQTSLAELQDDLDRQARNVDDLRDTHLLFLKRLSQRLLLARRATPVSKLLREALRTVLLFQGQLAAQSWHVEGGELRHPAFRRFQLAHTKFRQTVSLLLTTLKSWEELQCPQNCFKLSSVLGSTVFPDAAVPDEDLSGSIVDGQATLSDCSGISSIV